MKFLHKLLILIFYQVNFLSALHTKGKWDTNNEFFHIISKFGFQKTNQHEIDLSEGYIFGNITLLHNSSSNKNILQNYATLALLPEKFFVDFYENRKFKYQEDPDITCQMMFKVLEFCIKL